MSIRAIHTNYTPTNSRRCRNPCEYFSTKALKVITCTLAIFTGLGTYLLAKEIARMGQQDDLYQVPNLADEECYLQPASNPLRPESHPIQRDALREWVGLHCNKKERRIAEKIANATRHISQGEFEEALARSVDSFNRQITALPKEQQKYVILVHDQKSSAWVTELALPKLAVRPEKIVQYSCFSLFQKEHPEINRFAYFDDAVYSGEQVRAYLKSFRKGADVHLIIPYMTDEKLIYSPGKQIHLASHEKIALLSDILGSDSRQLQLYNPHQLSRLTVTYFDHKVGDSISFFEPLVNGRLPIPHYPLNRDDDLKCYIRRKKVSDAPVPQFRPPYKKK